MPNASNDQHLIKHLESRVGYHEAQEAVYSKKFEDQSTRIEYLENQLIKSTDRSESLMKSLSAAHCEGRRRTGVELQMQIQDTNTLKLKCDQLEREVHRHSEAQQLWQAESLEKDAVVADLREELADQKRRADTLGDQLASQISRVEELMDGTHVASALNTKLAEEQYTFISELSSVLGMSDHYPVGVLYRLSIPCNNVTVTKPISRCLLDKEFSLVRGEPANRWMDKDGRLGASIQNAVITIVVQLDRNPSTTGLDSLLWNLWSTLESYDVSPMDDRGVCFMPLVYLVRLISRKYFEREISEFSLWVLSQVTLSIRRWQPEGFAITELSSDVFSEEILNSSRLARTTWNRIQSGDWEQNLGPLDRALLSTVSENWLTFECTLGRNMAIGLMYAFQDRQMLLVVIQWPDERFIVWYNGMAKAMMFVNGRRPWLRLDDGAGKAFYPGFLRPWDRGTMEWLARFVPRKTPSIIDEQSTV